MVEFNIRNSDIVVNKIGSILYYKKNVKEYAKPIPVSKQIKKVQK